MISQRTTTQKLTRILIIFTCLSAGMPAFAQNAAGKYLHLKSGAVDPLAMPGLRSAASQQVEPSKDGIVAIVQFHSADSAWKDFLAQRGFVLRGYVPEDAYIIQGRESDLAALAGDARVRWIGPVLPEYKVSPALASLGNETRRAETPELEMALWPGESDQRILEVLAQLGAENVFVRHDDGQGKRILFTLDVNAVAQVAAYSEVEWIEEQPKLTRRLNSVRPVVQSGTTTMNPLYDRNLFGDGQIVGHIDGDIDYSMCFFRDDTLTTNTPQAAHRKIIAFYGTLHPGDSSGTEHGTASASVIAGQVVDPAPILNNAGVAPLAKLVHSYDLSIGGYGDLTSSTLRAAFVQHYGDGARVHSNSWGDDTKTVYTLWCRDIDSFSYDYEESLVIFAASNLSSLRTPENAKNCLAVGASQEFPNINNHYSGGTGPTNDGRRKPEIYAPGRSVAMADAFTACDTRTQGGTSFAAPAIAGAAALVREYFLDGFYPTGTRTPADSMTPTGSLVKATLLNGTVDMTGIAGYPSDQEGWGRLILDQSLYFNGDSRELLLADVRHANGFASANEQRVYKVFVNTGEPLRITLVWADRPAAHLADPAIVNDLDLKVIAPDNAEYVGNVFAAGQSVTGGSFDRVNNVEQVILNAPATGEYRIELISHSIPMGPQGFALAATADFTGTITEGETSTNVEHWWLFR